MLELVMLASETETRTYVPFSSIPTVSCQGHYRILKLD